MNIVCAPDKFRGTATALDVIRVVTHAARDHAVDGAPMADGGEGTLESLSREIYVSEVRGPLGDPVRAQWGMQNERAVIEMSRASGWTALGDRSNDPIAASTFGTGELIRNAIDAGAKEIIVGCGGSVSTDGGVSALEAIGTFPPDVTLTVLTDVLTAFVDAADEFGPQKGADAEQVFDLTTRLKTLAAQYVTTYGVDVRDVAGSGAAGGLAGGLVALGGRIHEGFPYIARAVDLDRRIRAADLVITGEGAFDHQSLNGKVTGGVIELARRHHKPVLLIAGRVDMRDSIDDVTMVSLTDEFGPDESMRHTLQCIHEIVERAL